MITNGKPDFDMDPLNVASTLFKLLEKADASDFSSVTHNLLGSIIEKRKIFDKTINENQYTVLKTQYDVSISFFDNLELDDPFEEDLNIVNETVMNSQPKMAQ